MYELKTNNVSAYWKKKNIRAEEALRHVDLMDKKYFNEIGKSVGNTYVYNEYFVSNRYDVSPTNIKIKLIDSDSVSAVLNCENNGKIAVLNFASYKYPGGGFLKGSNAQEETLCSESTLYNVLINYPDFYKKNRENLNNGLYKNRAIFSNGIIFKRKGKVKKASVITCAAPNKRVALKNDDDITEKINYEVLKSRIEYIFDIVVENSVSTLILGAYGCGVFGQDASEVAILFLETINKRGSFAFPLEDVIFAVPKNKNNKNYEKFKKAIKGYNNKIKNK